MNALSPANVRVAKLTRAGAFYMLLPVLLLGSGVLGWVVMIRATLSDPSVAIEPDYYNQATNTDREKAILVQSQELGWAAEVESLAFDSSGQGTLVLRMRDGEGRALEGLNVNVTAFPNVRAGDRQQLSLTAAETGKYSASLSRIRRGLWEIRVVAQRGNDEFHATLRHEIFSPRTLP